MKSSYILPTQIRNWSLPHLFLIMVICLFQLLVSLLLPGITAVHIKWTTSSQLLLTISYVVTTFFRTSGSRPWGSKLGYWSVRLNTSRGLLSGPVIRGERAKMHCFRLATAERPHSSLKDTMAFCKKNKKNYSWACMQVYWFLLVHQAKHMSNGTTISKWKKLIIFHVARI